MTELERINYLINAAYKEISRHQSAIYAERTIINNFKKDIKSLMKARAKLPEFLPKL